MKKSFDISLLKASGVVSLIFAIICSNNYRKWICDISDISILLISLSLFMVSLNNELYKYIRKYINRSNKEHASQRLLDLKDKHPLTKKLNWDTYLLYLYTLLQFLPITLYLCITYVVVYNPRDISSWRKDLIAYNLDWVPYYIIFFIPLLWLVGSFYHCNKQKFAFETKELNRLTNLALTTADSFINPYSPTHPYNQVLETMSKVNEAKKKAVEEGIQHERTKVELITNISHDLKTPLTAITNYVELLSKESLAPTSRDYVEVISNKVKKLSEMITSVFELSKTASGAAQLNFVSMDMNCLVEQVQSDLSDEIDKNGCTFRLNLSKKPTTFYGDSASLYRILQNLISNAIKYSLQGTRIFINTDVTSGFVKLTILNTSNYEMSFNETEILERFTRGDVSRSTEGNGLGLAIVKTYTEACGGQFEIKVEGDQFRASIQFTTV